MHIAAGASIAPAPTQVAAALSAPCHTRELRPAYSYSDIISEKAAGED